MHLTRPPRRSAERRRSSGPHAPPGSLDRLVEARDKLRLALVAADGVRHTALARVRRSRLVRWRHRAPVAHELLLAPPDLRPVDPSFADEVASGSMGLAGLTVSLGEASPFAITPPSPGWASELHGFGWLRHFAVTRTLENEALARRLVQEWRALPRRHHAAAWAPEAVGRRVLSWLAHAGLLLNGAGRREHAGLLRSLEDQTGVLAATWRDAAEGYPRLLTLIALVQSCLCIGGHERRLDAAQKALVAELTRQILDDGGHLSRNPATLVTALLDLLPLPQCFGARGLTPDPALASAIDRMMRMLRRLRLGDGQLARFNGMGATERDALAVVLAYQRGPDSEPPAVSASGYVRLQRGTTAVVVDAGAPPPLVLSGQACAGCLSFELSAGTQMLLANGGVPVAAHERAMAAARGTASHNTLVLGGKSSATLVRSASLRRRIGSAPIRQPDRVSCVLEESDGAVRLRASHDGYASRFGLIHARVLRLSADGLSLDGEDILEGSKGEIRLPHDLPVAVHFHLMPLAGARYGATQHTAELMLPSGACWRLTVTGATLTIEAGTYFADVLGPTNAQQIVLRTVCQGATRIRWRLEQV